jgi:cell division protein FtsZ
MNAIKRYAAEDAHVIFGAAYDETLGDQLRVTVIATGLSSARRIQAPPAPLTVVQTPVQAPVLRTGTDNLPLLQVPVGSQAHSGNPSNGLPHAAPDYGQMHTPSVWRNPRTQAAAKVEALSSNGMDDLDIPAFLRRQAD